MGNTIYTELGIERTRERIELVRLYTRIGLREEQIIQRLTIGDYLNPIWEYGKCLKVIRKDIKYVKREDQRRFNQLQEDAKIALAEYIFRQVAIFEKSIEDGNLTLASTTSKDIARAYGLATEEPVVIKGDIISQMKAAFSAAQQKIDQRRSLPIPINQKSTEVIVD